MKYLFLLVSLFNFIVLSACSSIRSNHQENVNVNDPLFETVSELDSKVFNAFNNCSSPERLQEYGSYFSPDVEFYHDSGGVTWTRDAMLENTKQYVCGKFRRELVSDSLKVFPVKDFGAISEGENRFCQFGESRCDGIAKFTIIWRKQKDKWEISRVLSYGHRANK